MSEDPWTPEEWDDQFCRDMIGYLKHDLDSVSSPRILTLQAQMHGVSVETLIRRRREGIEGKIAELETRLLHKE